MSQASIIINVSGRSQVHSNGLSGQFIVPGKKASEDFAILVVYPTPEVQDIGDGRRVTHWLKAAPIAKDIVGLRSDAASHGQGSPGTKEKWGLLVCEAEPDLPKELLVAIEKEIEYLNENMPEVRMKGDKKTGAVVAFNIEPVAVQQEKERLSFAVQDFREQFEQFCRTLVTKKELKLAMKNLLTEDQRMVAQADQMWASPAAAIKESINELHRESCQRLGQERPWCYVPHELVDCPGCGAKIKQDILKCPQCNGWLDEGIDALRKMNAKDRRVAMYPTEAVAS